MWFCDTRDTRFVLNLFDFFLYLCNKLKFAMDSSKSHCNSVLALKCSKLVQYHIEALIYVWKFTDNMMIKNEQILQTSCNYLFPCVYVSGRRAAVKTCSLT